MVMGVSIRDSCSINFRIYLFTKHKLVNVSISYMCPNNSQHNLPYNKTPEVERKHVEPVYAMYLKDGLL